VSFSAFLYLLLWQIFLWKLTVQMLFVLTVGTVGEHYVSSQGFYHYSQCGRNGPFLGNVPIWIPLMWLTIVQGTLVMTLLLNITGLMACVIAGLTALAADSLLIEPILSKRMGLWRWTSVERGYFAFVPHRLKRLTAPFGNYVVWFGFVGIANYLLVALVTIFP
jgi:hypothetical protein